MSKQLRLTDLAPVLGVLFALTTASTVFAQPAVPPPPPPGWTGSFAAGLALTQGNSDTSTVNLAYDVKRDTGSLYLFKSNGLFLRGASEGELTARRLLFDARLDRKLSDRTSLYVQGQFLEDEFKQIDYLVSPTVGLAYALIKNTEMDFSIDGGVGVVTEKNPGFDARTSGALTAGETYRNKITPTAEITQRVTALWKTSDFDDALYVLGIGLAANVSDQTQLKVELLDTYKNRPPSSAVKKNDVAVLLSFVYKY
jgi:putative salt-induced outer membrane protein YdiY